ncbi:hypothetical protein M3210_11535 [Oceanobacillus luteolus]|uniref:AbrB/MazE/SpoVT family DNA-binding domain-containing protein n=1 Tax=Oceanobacillus luteolus TaxID=1274358 RepID=A0ABW4HX73_9BACI|nr:AbrB/MazE/SpoVT family DNA-binding domain-containing protein [Oceanobacillus luteolus]MCM3740905.1 hypothetical protein [Oceanobacillus luteolus]
MDFLKKIRASKLGTISLPKKERTELGFEPGTLMELHLQGEEIWIYHSQNDANKNQRNLSNKGTLTIPAEFRNLLNITRETELYLFVDREMEAFIIKLNDSIE